MASKKRKTTRKTKKREPGTGILGQLIHLKTLTHKFGMLHEAQVFQLKCWGRLALPHADEIEFKVALPHLDELRSAVTDVSHVEFIAKASKRPPKNLKTLLTVLKNSVHEVLGEQFGVSVVINGTRIFGRPAPLDGND